MTEADKVTRITDPDISIYFSLMKAYLDIVSQMGGLPANDVKIAVEVNETIGTFGDLVWALNDLAGCYGDEGPFLDMCAYNELVDLPDDIQAKDTVPPPEATQQELAALFEKLQEAYKRPLTRPLLKPGCVTIRMLELKLLNQSSSLAREVPLRRMHIEDLVEFTLDFNRFQRHLSINPTSTLADAWTVNISKRIGPDGHETFFGSFHSAKLARQNNIPITDPLTRSCLNGNQAQELLNAFGPTK